MPRLVLASASPNRRQILENAGLQFVTMTSDANEDAQGLTPAQLVLELTKRKMDAVLPRCLPEDIVVTADTVVSVDQEILGKPADAQEAVRFLHLLSGRTHVVYTGVRIVYRGAVRTFYQTTEVQFYPLTEEEIQAYVDSGEAFGKAGAYGIQGPAALFVERIVGDYNNIFGLPVAHMMREIRQML